MRAWAVAWAGSGRRRGRELLRLKAARFLEIGAGTRKRAVAAEARDLMPCRIETAGAAPRSLLAGGLALRAGLKHLREQADLCRRWAKIAKSIPTRLRLIELALYFEAEADAAEDREKRPPKERRA